MGRRKEKKHTICIYELEIKVVSYYSQLRCLKCLSSHLIIDFGLHYAYNPIAAIGEDHPGKATSSKSSFQGSSVLP